MMALGCSPLFFVVRNMVVEDTKQANKQTSKQANKQTSKQEQANKQTSKNNQTNRSQDQWDDVANVEANATTWLSNFSGGNSYNMNHADVAGALTEQIKRPDQASQGRNT